MNFKDFFSRQSDIYLKARPTYPDELFEYLVSLSPSTELCWDCGTGNGQAAISLARYFEKVIATDGSEKQIANAMQRDNIEYRVANAENSGLPAYCADLITAATAAHWFEHDKFYAEVQRVAKSSALIAVWAYSEAFIEPEIDKLMDWFMYDFLKDYWPAGRWYVKNSYDNLPFPFEIIKTPQFYCKRDWKKEQWLDYVKSWSSYNNYVIKHNTNPLPFLLPELDKLWAGDEIKHVTWKLNLKCAIV